MPIILNHLKYIYISYQIKTKLLNNTISIYIVILTLPESSHTKNLIGIFFMFRIKISCKPRGQSRLDRNSFAPSSLGKDFSSSDVLLNAAIILIKRSLSLTSSSSSLRFHLTHHSTIILGEILAPIT